MKRLWLVLLFVAMFGGGLLMTLLSAAERAGWFETKAAASVPTAPAVAGPLPKAVTGETDHYFGVMEIGDREEHDFIVRNAGDALLTLTLRGTSCKCTLAELNDGAIPPGGERVVRLEWEAKELSESFRHGAILATNDPQQPELRLTVNGTVRRRLVMVPDDAIIIGRALPDERSSHHAWFYSQIYPALEVDHIESTHPYLSWEVEEIDPTDMEAWHATAGKKLRIVLEPGQAEGRHGGHLKIHLRVPGWADDRQPEPVELPVLTQVRGKFRIFGPLLQEQPRVLDLGQLEQGTGLTTTVFVALRGEHAEITVRELEMRPDFLEVKFERDETSHGAWTRYRLTVGVPPNAPLADCQAHKAGEIRLLTDSPDIPEISFPVTLAIAPPSKSEYEAGVKISR